MAVDNKSPQVLMAQVNQQRPLHPSEYHNSILPHNALVKSENQLSVKHEKALISTVRNGILRIS